MVGKKRPRREYLIKWEDYGTEHNSWEPEQTILQDSKESVQQFWAYAKQPMPAPLCNLGVLHARSASRLAATHAELGWPLSLITTTLRPRNYGLGHDRMA